jgi:hypothetical protein
MRMLSFEREVIEVRGIEASRMWMRRIGDDSSGGGRRSNGQMEMSSRVEGLGVGMGEDERLLARGRGRDGMRLRSDEGIVGVGVADEWTRHLLLPLPLLLLSNLRVVSEDIVQQPSRLSHIHGHRLGPLTCQTGERSVHPVVAKGKVANGRRRQLQIVLLPMPQLEREIIALPTSSPTPARKAVIPKGRP